MSKQVPKIGDIFTVPIEDNSLILGQIIEIQKEVMNSITCAFYDKHVVENEDITDLNFKIISIQFVTKDLFSSGEWKRIGNLPITVKETEFPYRNTISSNWVGAKIIGSGIIRKFLGAYYGLRKWNEMADENYYKKLLHK